MTLWEIEAMRGRRGHQVGLFFSSFKEIKIRNQL